MSNIKGSCLCGNVQYESTSEPLMVAVCHCDHCQKQSGSAFSVNIAVPPDSLTITGDSLKGYKDTTNSGLGMERKFCGNCGSPIFSDVTAAGLYFIKAGTLTDSSWVEPGAEIWCDEKVAWGKHADELPKMPANPPLGE